MPEPPKDLSQGSWRWNGFEWVPSEAPDQHEAAGSAAACPGEYTITLSRS